MKSSTAYIRNPLSTCTLLTVEPWGTLLMLLPHTTYVVVCSSSDTFVPPLIDIGPHQAVWPAGDKGSHICRGGPVGPIVWDDAGKVYQHFTGPLIARVRDHVAASPSSTLATLATYLLSRNELSRNDLPRLLVEYHVLAMDVDGILRVPED